MALIRVEQMEEPGQTKGRAVAVARRVIPVMAVRLVDAAPQVERQVPAAAAVEQKAFPTVKDASVVKVVALVVAVLAYLVKVLAVPPLLKTLLSTLNPQDAEVLAEQMVVLVVLIVNQVQAVITVAEAVAVIALEEALEPFVLSGPDVLGHSHQQERQTNNIRNRL